MQELNMMEVDEVSGGSWSRGEAALLTVGLMALAPASLLVIGVGICSLGILTVLD